MARKSADQCIFSEYNYIIKMGIYNTLTILHIALLYHD